MKVLVILLVGWTLNLAAEGGLSQADIQAIEMLRAQKEMQQQEQDWKNPVKVAGENERGWDGPKNSKISIVCFSDFQCPYCKRGADTVHEVMKKYAGKVKFQFRHMPLNFHPMAMPAAKWFEGLALQSTKLAYKFHDELFKNQDRLKEFTGPEGLKKGEAFLNEIAKKVGGNLEKLKKDVEGEPVQTRINADMAEAAKLGISGTPAFIVAGVRLYGAYPAEEFSKIIDRRLKATN